jgi:hypothetical protein
VEQATDTAKAFGFGYGAAEGRVFNSVAEA